MLYKIAICDDVEEDAQYIASTVKKWAGKCNFAVDVAIFPSADSFWFQYAEQKDYDILLLDVEMRPMNGVELAKKIRNEDTRVEIVFVTSHFELSGEGYEVDALHYLVKPVAEDKLMEVLSKAIQKLAIDPPSVVITCNGETVKLYESNILYVEAFLHYIVIYTKNGEYKLKGQISTIAEKLSDNFYCTHRSYLVSLQHIIKITRSAVFLDNGTELPLARGRYDEIHRAFIVHN